MYCDLGIAVALNLDLVQRNMAYVTRHYIVELTTWLAITEKTLSLRRGHSVVSLHQTARLQRDNGVCFIGEAEKERPLTIVDAVVWSWWLGVEGAVVLQQYTAVAEELLLCKSCKHGILHCTKLEI